MAKASAQVACQTTLLDGLFKKSQATGKDYLHRLDVDRLVAPCYEAAHLRPKNERYGGWESTSIAGHSVGHWLSAAAAMYAVTEDEALLRKLHYAIDELAWVQSHDSDGYVSGFPRDCFDRVFFGEGEFEVHNFGLGGSWVPWYSIHKIYAGLIDVYKMTGIEKALQVVTKLADWAKKGADRLTEEQFQRMLICEHGGMNEAMADLYLITGNRDYLELAIRFCHQAILEPLARGVDELEGKHANTQIPKVIGAAKLYDITGEEKYRKMAEFFWQEVTRNRSYIIGGNSIFEHFRAKQSEKLGVETAETCNTYNMLKLTSLLFRWSPNAEYMDYYERALYNHILASQDPDSGAKMYFISTEPGHFKVYGTHDQSFWCCTGTGMENPALYSRDIYHHVRDELYVNLFIASKTELPDLNIILRQETDFPRSNHTKLVLEKAPNERFKLRIRVPYWAAGSVTAIVGESECYSGTEGGFLEIDRIWNIGDTVEITLPMDLHVYRAKDDEKKVGFMYGPIVLAGALGKEKFPECDIVDNHLKLHQHPLIDVPILVTEEDDVKQWIMPVQGEALTFEIDAAGEPGGQNLRLIPFYELHHQRYTIYWTKMNREQYESYVDVEKEERNRLHAITIDVVYPHEQQSEVEHAIQSQESKSEYSVFAQKGYRVAENGGYFSYRMAIAPDRDTVLQVTYFGSDGAFHNDRGRHERSFDILINETVIARQKLEARHPEQLFEVIYDIPEQLMNGSDDVEVKFASADGGFVGGVYGIRMIDRLKNGQWGK
ncbi:glycoside hydrolase family 127 protein [Paenibacillus sp. LHD-117]|uniref:beta-L-arabinofuranosidase domain-containing protein n=1 Tax=Paenibacillus sp. LHD-117 TaxID=3071412 RepID=UPI0027DF31EF|nr:beta-L-arabinofuranosidase domain-containing protein [Paenibacillus sp. LHD-117]MDQ6417962.1 glycoside hydrolase family 127 protein [Paenibacillus sp. LHD-117]